SYVYMHFRSDPNWVISLRGRAGLGVDRTLLYGKIGLAVADFDHSVTSDFTPSDSWNGLDATNAGVIGGFGIEHAFTDRFSARFEGLLDHFGKNGHHNVGGRLMRTGTRSAWPASASTIISASRPDRARPRPMVRRRISPASMPVEPL